MIVHEKIKLSDILDLNYIDGMKFFIVAIFTVFALFAVVYLELLSLGVARADQTEPKEILVGAVSKLGIFDPSVAYTPAARRKWMSYSAINPSPRWPKKNTRAVTTRLAFSDDNGASWKDAGHVVNEISEVELPRMFNKAGTWNSEVSSLVYDPGANASERWKLFWHHYLLVNESRRFESGWIALKSASSPEDLATAKEIKLFTAGAYQDVYNDPQGGTKSPVAGPSVVQLAKLHPELSKCIVVSEPGVMVKDSALYLTMNCFEQNWLGTKSKIVLLKCAAPCRATDPQAWAYLGSPLSVKDASRRGFDLYSASDIYSENGKNYLIVSPSTDQPVEGAYNGCLVFRFLNLENGELERINGNSVVVREIMGTQRSFNGACTYQPDIVSGFIYGQITFGDSIFFRIFGKN